jgi:class 3 adenylate cyclase/tetratricopeptide (TPR) repeat protein
VTDVVCPVCQHPNPGGARFCNGCGGPLPAACAQCGHENPSGSAFCNRCGAPCAGAAPERDPRAYTPRNLAERILQSRSALEGERKHVTILFCDLADSTPLAERIGPEAMHEIMDRCFAVILEQVHRYEGTVNQFLGDGVMALFGAPLALEDAPRRAVTAALALQRAIGPLAEEVQARHAASFQLRIGVHSGPVVVGRIGDDLRMDYTAVGDTTNLASRLQGLARPGSVLISEATAHAVAGYFDLEELGEVQVKGRVEPVRAARVIAERGVLGRVEARAESGLTALVGRDPELRALERAFEAAQAGRGQVVFVVGEAGIGKSRLRYEFQRGLEGQPHAWIEGRCMPYARDFPFHPIVDALRREFGIEDGDDDGVALAKLDAYEERAGGGLEATLSYVRLLLSLPSGDEDVDALDAATRRSETFGALRARFERMAARTPFVLVIEDIHWIDKASEEFLEYLVDSIPAAPVLLLLTHRPGARHRFGDRSYSTRLSLQPLSDTEMGHMAEAILQSYSVPSALRQLIAARAEGNPFFIEEVVQSLLEDGSLQRRGDRIELGRDVESISVPDSIQGVLMARLDRLPDEPKRALQIGAVIGREFALRLLERIVEAGDRLGPMIEELRGLELIYEKAAHPELAFMFKHALTRDVAYDSVLSSRRKALHRIVGLAIEELYQDRLTEQVEHLAHHFTAGEEWEKAFLYSVRAARKAAEVFANQSAVEHCRRALEIAERLGEPVSLDDRRELEELRGMCGAAISDFPDSGHAFLRAAELAEAPGDRALNLGRAAHSFFWGHLYPELDAAIEEGERFSSAHGLREGLAFSKMMRAFRGAVFGELDEHVRLLSEVERTGVTHPEVVIVLRYLRGQQAEWYGDYRAASAAQAEGIEIARKHRLPGLLVPSLWSRAKAMCCLGEYGEALRLIREAYELAERIGDRHQRTRMLNTLGWVYAELGAYEQAADSNRRSVELADELLALGFVAGTPEIHSNASINLAGNLIALGDLEGAEQALGPVREDLQGPGDPFMRWRYSLHLSDLEARLALARGEPEQALPHIEAELASARTHGARKVLARAQELRGRALLALDDREAAEADLREALRGAQSIGYPPVCWRALALLGEVARRAGSSSQAEERRAAAGALVEDRVGSLGEAALSARLRALGVLLAEDPIAACR